MKHKVLTLILLSTFVILSSIGYCQTDLGKTKQDIINQYNDCNIYSNTEGVLILVCDRVSRQFRFKKTDGLCWISSLETDIADLSDIESKYKESENWVLDPNPSNCNADYIKLYCYNGISCGFSQQREGRLRILIMKVPHCCKKEGNE